jgi:hypothetical protein
MENFIDTFLSLGGPSTIIGASIYIADKEKISKASNPCSVPSTWIIILTWLAELACLWLSFLMASLLYEVSAKDAADDVFSTNKWLIFCRAVFVSLVVVVNLGSGLSLGFAKMAQNALCCGTFHNEIEKGKGFKGGPMKYLYFVLEVIMVVALPLVGLFGIHERISKYDSVCDGDVLKLDMLDGSKELSMGTYYGWTILFFGISLAIRLARSLVFSLLHGVEKNNMVSNPSFSEAKSFFAVNKILQEIEENVEMERDIRKNSRYEVTYDLSKSSSKGIGRADLQFI